MAMEISHAPEAWRNVRRRLSLKKWIVPMRHALQNDDHAKWRCDPTDTRSEQEVLSASYSGLSHQALVDEIMRRIEDHRTCSNNGRKFHLDRTGWETCPCSDLSPLEERHLPDWSE